MRHLPTKFVVTVQIGAILLAPTWQSKRLACRLSQVVTHLYNIWCYRHFTQTKCVTCRFYKSRHSSHLPARGLTWLAPTIKKWVNYFVQVARTSKKPQSEKSSVQYQSRMLILSFLRLAAWDLFEWCGEGIALLLANYSCWLWIVILFSYQCIDEKGAQVSSPLF